MKRTTILRVMALLLFLAITACARQTQNNEDGLTTNRGEVANVPEFFYQIIAWIALVIETAGILIIVIGIFVATIHFFSKVRSGRTFNQLYQNYREYIGRAILLGLEFLVAADIVGTVAVQPTFENLGVLGLIILIRTFLSFAIEIEIHGHFPWQQQSQIPQTNDRREVNHEKADE
jgi:uncharacterized membrane protein